MESKQCVKTFKKNEKIEYMLLVDILSLLLGTNARKMDI